MDEQKDYKKIVLDAYFDDEVDSGHFSSQDICDNLRETISLTPDEVTRYMIGKGYTMVRQDDRLVWTKL